MKRVILKLQSVFILFLLFLPFTNALTIRVGFPLKLSELLLLFLILIIIASLISIDKIKPVSKINLLLIVFLIWATISFFVNSIWKYDYELKSVPYRVGPFFDSLMKLVYVYLAILTFFITQKFISRNDKILIYWCYGAILASSYSWYLFISSGLGLPYFKLMGMDEHPQQLMGFVRCGTFKEGNYFGLYLLLSAVISFYLKRNKFGVFFIITIATTLSTMSLVSLIVLIMYLSRKFFLRKKVLLSFLFVLPILLISISKFSKTSFFQDHFYSKLFEPSNKLTSRNFSKVDRVLTGRIAFKQGINNPLLGVGPYNYGLHYDEYNDFKTYFLNNSKWSNFYFQRKNKRAIPNNIYMELWSEYGIVGFLIFVLFLLSILIKAYRIKNDILVGGILALIISFNAFPSFIMLFLWVFLAIPLGRKYD